MESSYDRSGGNNDGHSFQRFGDDGRPIIADLTGPGCVRRFWFTGMHPDAKLYFRFDGEQAPSLIITCGDLRYAKRFPFIIPLAHDPSGAGISYVPLLFKKRLIITAEPLPGPFCFFYQVNYETFSNNVGVESFSMETAERLRWKFEDISNCWHNISINTLRMRSQPEGITGKRIVLQPMTKTAVWEEKGPAIVHELDFNLQFPKEISVNNRNRLLRELVLRIFWNNAQSPSVEVPFGDFFCNGVRLTTYNSMYLSRHLSSFTSRFPMPFRQQMRIEIHNESSIPLEMEIVARSDKLKHWDTRLRYFHAFWNQSHTPGKPHDIISVQGAGHYAGTYLTSIGMDGSWNILESDESMFLDGEVMSSLHGTGLEDYFNGGWYYNYGIFQSPLAAVLERSGIRTTQYRFHLPDPVNFAKSFKMNIEFGSSPHGNNVSRGYMSSVAYYYMQTPGACNETMPNVCERHIPRDPLEKDSFFCELWEKERLGLFSDAIDYCKEYAEKYAGTAEAEMMQLRIIAYQERLGILNTRSKEVYKEFEKTANSETVRSQAKLLNWFNSSLTNGYLLAHINGAKRIYYDGNLVMAGDDFINASVIPLVLIPGTHVVCAEVTGTHRDPWVSMYLRGHSMEMWTDSTWKMSEAETPSWNAVNFDDSSWSNSPCGGPLPWMPYFQFKPNAFINAQNQKQLLYHPISWPAGKTIYFRKRFEVK
ncbi:MAG: hypothetical protein A2283_01125 [Lentisphaerae bacterium RIFOXYA12_FULL_48_11]|nr:MAG: hypothetical protein A2283_01125 [Lentisphaerae bacterium RIFOXYA12_FULL_48_11]